MAWHVRGVVLPEDMERDLWLVGDRVTYEPVLGVTEIVSQSIVGIVFLQLADAQRRGRMIRSDIILAGLLRRP